MNSPSAANQSTIIRKEILGILGNNQEIRALCEARALPFVIAAIANWGMILASIWLSNYYENFALYGLACLLIASRQHAFFALTHEATHNRISRNQKINDRLSNWLFAYPILFDTEAYRSNHLKHHSYLNSKDDPDWMRKINLDQWQFPMKQKKMISAYPKFLFWTGAKEWVLIMLQLARILPLKDITSRESAIHVAKRASYYAALCLPICFLGHGKDILLYWVIPLLFVFPTLQRIRSIAEHFGLSREHDLEQSRNIMASGLETFFFAPYNLNYHLDHHLIAAVPFYNLPKLHKILARNSTYQKFAHQNTSYLLPSKAPLLRDLLAADPQGEPTQDTHANAA